MKAREWRIKPPHIHGLVEDCIGGREIRHCDGCGASEAVISVPDYKLSSQPCWPGFLDFVERHKDCVLRPKPVFSEEQRERRRHGQKRRRMRKEGESE